MDGVIVGEISWYMLDSMKKVSFEIKEKVSADLRTTGNSSDTVSRKPTKHMVKEK